MSGTGRVFDVLEEDILPDSFRQYVLTNLMLAYDKKAYMTTTGYNRVELDLNQALPADLIARIARWCYEEYRK